MSTRAVPTSAEARRRALDRVNLLLGDAAASASPGRVGVGEYLIDRTRASEQRGDAGAEGRDAPWVVVVDQRAEDEPLALDEGREGGHPLRHEPLDEVERGD